MHYLTDNLDVVFDETGTFSGIVLGREKTEALTRLVSISVSLLDQKKRTRDLLKVIMPKAIQNELSLQAADIDQKLEKLAVNIQMLK